jgi:hypothetical protein
MVDDGGRWHYTCCRRRCGHVFRTHGYEVVMPECDWRSGWSLLSGSIVLLTIYLSLQHHVRSVLVFAFDSGQPSPTYPSWTFSLGTSFYCQRSKCSLLEEQRPPTNSVRKAARSIQTRLRKLVYVAVYFAFQVIRSTDIEYGRRMSNWLLMFLLHYRQRTSLHHTQETYDCQIVWRPPHFAQHCHYRRNGLL